MLRDLAEPTNLVRIAAFTVLALLAVLPAMLAFGALSNLWADYKDSTDTTYLLVGGFALLIATLLAVLAVRVIWRAPDAVIACSMVVAAVAAAGFITYVQAESRNNGLRQIENLQQRPSPAQQAPLIAPIATAYPATSLPVAPSTGTTPR